MVYGETSMQGGLWTDRMYSVWFDLVYGAWLDPVVIVICIMTEK